MNGTPNPITSLLDAVATLRVDYMAGHALRTEALRTAAVADGQPCIVMLMEPMTPLVHDSMRQAGNVGELGYAIAKYVVDVVAECDPGVAAAMRACTSWVANPCQAQHPTHGEYAAIRIDITYPLALQAQHWRDFLRANPDERTH